MAISSQQERFFKRYYPGGLPASLFVREEGGSQEVSPQEPLIARAPKLPLFFVQSEQLSGDDQELLWAIIEKGFALNRESVTVLQGSVSLLKEQLGRGDFPLLVTFGINEEIVAKKILQAPSLTVIRTNSEEKKGLWKKIKAL